MNETDIENALPCPFCGGDELDIEAWSDEDGDFDAIFCNTCNGSAPATAWNNRTSNLKPECK